MDSSHVVFSPEKTVALVTAIFVAIISKAWNYVGLPVYWLFRHLYCMMLDRDPEMVKGKISKLFPDEMNRNLQTADNMERLQLEAEHIKDSVRGLTLAVEPMTGIAFSVKQLADSMTRQTAAMESLVTHQNEQNISVARLDERIKRAYETVLNQRHHNVTPPYERSHTRETD